MRYTVRYRTPLPSAMSLSAESAKHALHIAREVAANGHEPTIHDGDLVYSLLEFERVVASMDLGDDA